MVLITCSSEEGDDAIYDTVDEAKRGSSGNKRNVPNTLSERKQSLSLILSEKSITPKISDIKPPKGSNESSPNNPNTTEDSNYQPLIPPRMLNQENIKYQCLSPTQEHILGQYENDGAGVFTSDVDREKKTTYQSLIQEEQRGNVSSDYQCLTEFTQQPSIPVSPPQNIQHST